MPPIRRFPLPDVERTALLTSAGELRRMCVAGLRRVPIGSDEAKQLSAIMDVIDKLALYYTGSAQHFWLRGHG